MNQFGKSIEKMWKGAFEAVATFPITSLNAILFTIVTMIRIQLEWQQQEPYNLLFNSLHWAFSFGAIFGLMATTYVRRKNNQPHPLLLANLTTGIATLVAFLSLYFLGARIPGANDYFKYPILSEIAHVRMTTITLVTFFAYLFFASRPKEKPEISRAIFMNQKALVVAGIYGLVLMAGTSAIAGAIQALLYTQMSFKVYQYLGALVGLVTFMLFLGALPNFSAAEKDEKWLAAEKQARFIHLLFAYILTPIMIALTIVLLLWTVKTIFQGVGSNFVRLSGIATTYAVVGLWLHMMVEEAKTPITDFYLKAYPYAALVILAFEAWALVMHLNTYGLQTTEYYFIVTWVVAISSMLLILFKKEWAYVFILWITMGAMLFTVFPVVGYQSLPVRLQTKRLEQLLVDANMFKEGAIVPGSEELDRETRVKITSSALFLAGQNEEAIPKWLNDELFNQATFEKVMGFAPVYPDSPGSQPSTQYQQVFLQIEPGAIPIVDYDWAILLGSYYGEAAIADTIAGKNGEYQVQWMTGTTDQSIPKLKITLDNQVILEENMSNYLDTILKKYPLGAGDTIEVPLADMSHTFSNDQVSGIIVFRSVNATLDVREDTMSYWFEVASVYLKEK